MSGKVGDEKQKEAENLAKELREEQRNVQVNIIISTTTIAQCGALRGGPERLLLAGETPPSAGGAAP